MNHLSIATFNTWNCQGSLDRRLPLMVAGLAALDADIILMQEVFAQIPRGLNVAQRLANELNMDFVYSPAREKIRLLGDAPLLCHSGLAVLVKGAVKKHETVSLPEDARDGERLGQWVSVKTGDMSVLIGNTHLSHLQDEDQLREKQLQTLIHHRETQGRHDVCLLGGDMNLKTEHPIFQRLLKSSGLQAISFAQDQSPRTSLNPIDDKAPDAGIIDHLFVKSDRKNIVTAHARPALHTLDGRKGLYPSDHMAIVADLELR
ncbi:endonuclease/exonuclease/phosphatase family protein [Magnetovibrio blakemorei]|uniref:Endonuclease/exonuclease/phosphatase domain-containing protein n=1 Tax=Magnetovibrio blakemorei TaxID=28181 RepID=A0A1E5Q4X7_9PROT|nr:endonuclease/exonuclease/phosphatase family protein [Magnetovibrio blakemorei]OEJ65062.1 hypothetical protein BEN30_15340 [Magnetovibrio blakemorei]